MTRSSGVFGLFLISLIFSISASAETTFVEQCLGSTPILKSRIECRLNLDGEGNLLRFVLVKGEKLYIKGTGKFASLSKELNVERIAHLPPRLSDAGPMDESVRFLARTANGAYAGMMIISCHQDAYANVGLSKTSDGPLPPERVAECLAQ